MNLVTLIQQLGLWIQTNHYWAFVIFGGIFLACALLALLCRTRQTGAVSHGSARWATRHAIQQAGLLAPRGILLGKHGRRRVRSDKGHVLLCGPTGSGKDLSVNFPTTRDWRGSMIIVDVKDGGENYDKCRKERPGVVYRYAPTLPNSHCLNLLAGIDPMAPESFREVAILAESFLAPRLRGVRPSDSGEYFRHQAASTLRDVTLHCLQTLPQPSFPAVLSQMAVPKPLLNAMCQSATPYIRSTGERLRDMQQHAERQFAGIWDTAIGALDLFKDPVIARSSMTSDFTLTDLQHGAYPMTLYLGANAPTELVYLAPLFRAVLQSALHRLMTAPGERRELLWLLNEFPTLGYLEMVEQALATARSYDMRFLLVIQDLGQLWQTYGQDTPLWGNCGVKLFHGPSNDLTAKRMSDMLGPETVASGGTSTQGLWGRRTRSEHESGRPLLTEAEVLGMGADMAIVWADTCKHPILVQKCWEGR